MPTAFSSSSARARACFFETSSCRRIASASWSPILCTGLRLVIGSWKIIAISLPRISRSRRGLAVSRSSPFHNAVPEDIAVRFGFSPMIVRQVTLLPEPDSPTIPSVWPLSTENETPSTARTTPSSVLKYVFRSLTSRRGIYESLIRGSMTAYNRSTRRLNVMITRVAKTTTPWVTGRSNPSMA